MNTETDEEKLFSFMTSSFEEKKELILPLKELCGIINISVLVNDSATVVIQTDNYNSKNCSYRETSIILEEFQEIANFKNILKFVHSLFNDDGTIKYSRITDKVYDNNEEKENDEKLEIAIMFLLKNPNTTCSVCNEVNSVHTKCKHNLCRYCYTKMYNDTFCCFRHCIPILCPICRTVLNDNVNE